MLKSSKCEINSHFQTLLFLSALWDMWHTIPPLYKVGVGLPSVLCILKVFFCYKILRLHEASAVCECRQLAVTASLEVPPLTGAKPGVHLKTVCRGEEVFLEVPSSSDPFIASLSLICLDNNQALPVSVGDSQ